MENGGDEKMRKGNIEGERELVKKKGKGRL